MLRNALSLNARESKKLKSWICLLMIELCTKIEGILCWPIPRSSTKLYGNPDSIFTIILLANKQTNADENITSLADINIQTSSRNTKL